MRRRRLPRILLNAVTGISALLCALTLVVWIRGGQWLLVSRPTARLLRQTDGVLHFDQFTFDNWLPDEPDPQWDAEKNWSNFVGASSQVTWMSHASSKWVEHIHHFAGAEWWRFAGVINFYTRGLAKPKGNNPFPEDPLLREPIHVIHLGIPCRWLVPLTAALPLTTLVLRVRAQRTTARRRRSNLCPSCGYDLRATPDRCPECGAVPPPSPPAA